VKARVEIRSPSARDQERFLAASRRSRSFHGPWGDPPKTEEAFREYLRRHQSPTHEGHLLVERTSGELVGVVNVMEIVRGSFHSAYLGYYLFLPHGGRGFMTEGLGLVISRAFRELRLHRLEANIQPGNQRSIRLVERLGFRCEGLSPRYLKVGGRWRDHQRWALLREEWRPVARRMRRATR
jgi:ribosomal-protein-alanine N-acetyltransferase